MAKLSKNQFQSLWNRFQSNPNSLNINEYKSLLDSAHELHRNGEISESLAREVISNVSKYAQ